jgi:hypothetical protein
MPFRYPVCVTLDRYTGVQTAVLAINEVAAREFVAMAESSKKPDSFIFDKCQEHGMYVSRGYFPEFHKRRIRYYVAQTYELLEVFYRQFREEFEQFFGTDSWKQQSPVQRREEGDEGLLLEILRNVPSGAQLKPDPYVAIAEYYRLVRNCIVHALPKEEIDKKLKRGPDKTRERLVKRYGKEVPNKEYAFDAPNAIDSLTFDDVRLHSRCMQRLARRISELAAPNPQQLLNAVFCGNGGVAFRRSYRKLGGRPGEENVGMETRLKKALQFRLMDRYGFTATEAAHTLEQASWPIA